MAVASPQVRYEGMNRPSSVAARGPTLTLSGHQPRTVVAAGIAPSLPSISMPIATANDLVGGCGRGVSAIPKHVAAAARLISDDLNVIAHGWRWPPPQSEQPAASNTGYERRKCRIPRQAYAGPLPRVRCCPLTGNISYLYIPIYCDKYKAASAGGLFLKFSDELLGCKLSVRLGRVVVWRHDAAHLIATDDDSSAALSGYGRAPVPRFTLVCDYRKFRDIGHLNCLGRRTLAPDNPRCQRPHGVALGTAPLPAAEPSLTESESRILRGWNH